MLRTHALPAEAPRMYPSRLRPVVLVRTDAKAPKWGMVDFTCTHVRPRIPPNRARTATRYINSAMVRKDRGSHLCAAPEVEPEEEAPEASEGSLQG